MLLIRGHFANRVTIRTDQYRSYLLYTFSKSVIFETVLEITPHITAEVRTMDEDGLLVRLLEYTYYTVIKAGEGMGSQVPGMRVMMTESGQACDELEDGSFRVAETGSILKRIK